MDVRAGKTSPTGQRLSYRQAASVLAKQDPVIARLVHDCGYPHIPPAGETHFATLVHSIVYQ
jgi:6-phosphogluconate dehydrogenase (decarboxylating)